MRYKQFEISETEMWPIYSKILMARTLMARLSHLF